MVARDRIALSDTISEQKLKNNLKLNIHNMEEKQDFKQKLLEKEIDEVIDYHEQSLKGQLHLLAALKILLALFGAGLFVFLFQVILEGGFEYMDELESAVPIVLIYLVAFFLFAGICSMILKFYNSIFRTRLLISDYKRLRMLMLYDPEQKDAILYALTNDIFEMNIRGNKEVDLAQKSSGFKFKIGEG